MLIGGALSDWRSIDRPGYLGRRREGFYLLWNQRYGQDKWRLVWQIDECYFGIDGAVALYEDAYLNFLSANPDMTAQLITEAADVYDDDPSNVDSGLSYFVQETERTHLQDIAIRRCLVRMGRWFGGGELIQIRDVKGEHRLSLTLSPGRVPFHRPDLICQPELEGWWQPGSVESFYQSNRWLQVKDSD